MDLLHAVREALVEVLSQGTWEDIQHDHTRAGLGWRDDLSPGWGKPKYVKSVLADVDDAEVVALANRCLYLFPERANPILEDALWHQQSGGVIQLSAITRRAIVDDLDGLRLHPDEGPVDFLHQYAGTAGGLGIADFRYLADGTLIRSGDALGEVFAVFANNGGRPAPVRVTHHDLFDSLGYLAWPDKRFALVLEALVHPTTRRGDEQRSRVERINGRLAQDRFELREVSQLSGHPVFEARSMRAGGHGQPKNVIFASTGPKPELGFSDALDNDVVILSNAEHCLVFDEPLGEGGLSWHRLGGWWAKRTELGSDQAAARRSLGARLKASLASLPEKELFAAYFRLYSERLADRLPALLPQVYLHYDPATRRQLRERGVEDRFLAQRMDFLMLLPGYVRVVLEVDGQQHYATSMRSDARPSPRAYSDTVRSDRELRLAGYEVYRFSGYELVEGRAPATLGEFFSELFSRHRIK